MSSTAIVEVKKDRDKKPEEEEEVELPVDLSQIPCIPMSKSLLLVNNFVANTTRFLNHFANECEERINKVSTNLTRVEILLAILEAKLNSVPELRIVEPVETSTSTLQVPFEGPELPPADGGLGVPPPPPPPPSDSVVLMPPLPPPQPLLYHGAELDGSLVVSQPGEFASEETHENTPPALKFKDDPIYAKYV
jgi:WASH complex subunit CCDC53